MNDRRAGGSERGEGGTERLFDLMGCHRSRGSGDAEGLKIWVMRELLRRGSAGEKDRAHAGEREGLERIGRAGEVVAVEAQAQVVHLRPPNFLICSRNSM